MADETVSGLTPVITLSGIQGVPSFSGASQGAPAGGVSGYGGAQPGIEGGPDLLSLLLQQAGAGAAGDVGVGALTPFTAGSLGQQTGGLSAGSFGQAGAPGQAGIAGASAGGGQAGAGSTDPLAIIQKLLGLGSKAAGAFGGATSQTASPTVGDTGGTSLSDQNRSAQGAASPQPGVLTFGSSVPTGSPTQDINAPGVPPGLADPNALGGLPPQTPTGSPTDLSLTNIYGQGQGGATQGLYDALKGAGFSDSDILPILQSVGGAQGYSAGEIPGGGAAIPSGLSGSPTASPTSSLSGGIQGGLTGAGGLLSLIQGIQSGNVPQEIGGGLQGLGGLSQVLQSFPELAQSLGLSGDALSAAGAGIGGLGGLLGLAQGIQSGNPLQIGTGALGALSGASSLYGTLAGTGAGGISSLVASVAPEAAASIASALGSEVAANAGTQAISTALSGALSGLGAAAAPIIMGIVAYLGEADARRIRQAGFTNNPIAGGLYSNTTAGVQGAQNLYNQLNPNLAQDTTSQLENAVVGMSRDLLPYYQTAEGGAGVLRPSSTVTGGGLYENRGQGPDAISRYTGNFTQAQQGLVGLVNELLNRGVSYEDLGKLQVPNNWGQASLDMSDPTAYFYGLNAQKYNQQANQMLQQAEASPLLQRTGLNNEMLTLQNPNYMPGTEGAGLSAQTFDPSTWTPQALLTAVQGASGAAPDAVTHAGGLYSGMYGGPLWAELARMGGGTGPGAVGPQIWSQIQQHFNPWAYAQTESPEQLLATMGLPVNTQAPPPLATIQNPLLSGIGSAP